MFGGDKNPGLPARSDGESDEVAGFETGKEKAYGESIRRIATRTGRGRERERENCKRVFIWSKLKRMRAHNGVVFWLVYVKGTTAFSSH
jgi:hypothetical protein